MGVSEICTGDSVALPKSNELMWEKLGVFCIYCDPCNNCTYFAVLEFYKVTKYPWGLAIVSATSKCNRGCRLVKWLQCHRMRPRESQGIVYSLFPWPGKTHSQILRNFLESEYVVFRSSWSSDFLKYLSEVYWGKTPYFSFLYIGILLIINVELYLAVSVIIFIVYSWWDFRVFRRIHKWSCRLDGIAVTLIRLNSLVPRF